MIVEILWICLYIVGMTIVLYLILKRNFTKNFIKQKLFLSEAEIKRISAKKTSNLAISFFKKKLLFLTPIGIRKNLDQMIVMSNTKWQIEDILIFKFFIISIMFLLSFFVTQKINNYLFKILYISISILAGYKLPDIYLKSTIRKRQKNIQRSLPTFIDFLTICVEAGLGIDIAIYRVLNQMSGPLAEEIAKAMSEVKYGKTKKEAFNNLTDRVNVPETTSFFNSLISGEQLGISLGSVLAVQGQEMREKRKLKIQEEAFKVPIKLLFPLIIFILPGIFIILLGPAIIQVYETMFK